MDNFEKVDKLVGKTGVSYAKAKDALERSNWDLLEAIVLLEDEGWTEKKSAQYKAAGNDAEGETRQNAQSSYTYDEKYVEREMRREKRRQGCGKVRNFLANNYACLNNREGNQILRLPVWLAILVLVCGFWFSIIALLISFACGCSLCFQGPDLGREDINRVMESVAETTENIKNDIKDKCDERKAGHNGNTGE